MKRMCKCKGLKMKTMEDILDEERIGMNLKKTMRVDVYAGRNL